MGKSIRVAHKVKGEEIAAYMITDGVAVPRMYNCDEMGVAFSVARYLFTSEEHPAEGPDYAARVEKVGAKWRVHITVTYVSGGVFQNLYWTAGEFSGSRGTALYRAFLALGKECGEGGEVRAQLETEKQERYENARAILRMGEPTEKRENSAPNRSYVACSGTGKAPVSGSRISRNGHADPVPDDFSGPHKGACTVCGLVIAVNRDGVIRRHKKNAHNVSDSERTKLVAAERERRAKRHAARKYATTREDVAPGFDRRTAAPVTVAPGYDLCGVAYRRNGLGWIAYANTLPGAVSGTGQTIDDATDAMLTALRAEEFGTDTREDSDKIWGLSREELRAANAAHYATHPISPEVAALPDPHVKQWSGTDASDGGAVVACDFKGDVEIIDPEKIRGKCPECRAYIPLLDVKSDSDATRIGKHNRYGLATPAGAGMSSRSLETVEHGTVAGSQIDANKRRIAESRCTGSRKIARDASGRPVSQGGTYTCPHVITADGTVCGRTVELKKSVRQTKKGPVVRWLIPDHTEGRESFRGRGSDAGYVKGERKVTPRGDGADVGATVTRGKVSARLALSRGHGTVDGAANTGSQSMAPVQPGGWVGKAGTMSLPATVRPGIDPEVDTAKQECPVCKELPQIAHKGKSKSWRRNHARTVRAYWDADAAARKTARKAVETVTRVVRDAEGRKLRTETATTVRMTSAERKAARKAASIGSFAEGTIATTGTVAHGGKRPEVALKVKPRGKTRTGN